MINIDQAKTIAGNYIEAHAVDFAKFLVNASIAWIRNRHGAEEAIRAARVEYQAEMDSIQAHMQESSK